MLGPVAATKPIPAARAFDPDERQRQAIEHISGPMLVVAGAGTGKTTVLTRRLARLIREGHAQPNEILAVTYTKNAVQEMRERVRDELRGTNISGLQIATFHEYCNDLLARCGKQFGVLDDQDLWIYLRKRIHELHLNYFVRAANVSQFLHDLLSFMRRCQDDLVDPEKYSAYVRQLERGDVAIPRVSKSKDAVALSDEEVIGRCQEIAGVFTTIERMLREDSLGTFGHMITHAHDLLERDPELLSSERKRTRFLLADEFQDVNFAQVKILQKLAGEERNVFAVGDPDQAIYRFRGASSAAFGLFQEHFPDSKMVVLEKNRRSTTPILKSAFAHISKNPAVFQPEKGSEPAYRRSPLISAREEDASREGRQLLTRPVDAVVLAAKELEGSDLVTSIRDRQKKLHCKWSDFAVLYRQHYHREQIVAELVEQGIPFAIENMDVMDTPDARDLFACLGAVVSLNDSASLFRVASFPRFAVDPEELRAGMKAIPRDERKSGMAAVLAKIVHGPAVLSALQQVRDEIGRAATTRSGVLSIIIRHFGLNRNSPAIAAVLEFVKRWEEKPEAITRTGDIAEFIDYLQYFRAAGGVIPISTGTENAVRLMTAHVAKGLEFNHVFIIRANSNSFPSSYKEPLVDFPRELQGAGAAPIFDDKEYCKQEERRLFYVAMTRARDSLTIYGRRGRGREPAPDGYLRDLLKDPSLSPWLRQRGALEFQVELFAEEAPVLPGSPVSEWLRLPPAFDLGATLSASALQTYEICPLQFKLEREWRIPGEVPAAMEFGATIHRILLAYYTSVRSGRTIQDDQLIELFKSDLLAAGIEEKYQYQLYEQQGIEQLREFLNSCKRTPVPEVRHTEERFEMQIGPSKVVGRIDRIDQLSNGRVAIIDYKTGRPKSQEDADKSLQLSIYALAAREKWGYQADQIAFYNLEENSSVVTRRSDAQLQECRHKVQEVAGKIAAQEFDAKPGFYCGFCSYRSLCPATEKRLYTISSDNKSSSRN
jgi:superfamily I DNA/RNA helicase/RecB family exonuclease